MSNKTRASVVSITVTYADGSTEEFPKSFANKLRQNQGDHKTLAGFVLECFRCWDKEYALSRQAKQHERRMKELEEEQEEELGEQEERAKERAKVSLETQSAILRGQNLQKWLPSLAEYPYDNGDVISVFDTFDYLVLEGRVNQPIKSIVFQEVKTGNDSHSLYGNQLGLYRFIDGLKCPLIRFEHWARRVKDEQFALVKHHPIR